MTAAFLMEDKIIVSCGRLWQARTERCFRRFRSLTAVPIQANAPVETGAYKKSWTVKTVRETSQSLELVVHSKNRYQLAHLLEHGHALRNGGRARAFPHIAPAEEKGIRELEEKMERGAGRMTYEEVVAFVEAVGLPWAYDHFAEGESPDPLSIGMVNDMYVESGNDSCKYARLADQKDFDSF